MNDIAIRPACPEDIDRVAELRWRWWQERHGTPTIAPDEFVPRFVAWTRENRSTHRCLVAVRDNAVIGMVWLAVTQRVPHPLRLERATGDLQCAYVRPEERDRGVGGRLIEAVLALARELGLERVTVHSSEGAVSAYARNGFHLSPRLLHATLEG